MNRSILIVICDFLLLSLLAFSAVDINHLAKPGAPQAVQKAAVTNRSSPSEDSRDLAAAMRMALNEERKGRDQLLVELENTRGQLTQQQTRLNERDRQVQTFRQQVESREQQALQLQQQQADLERQLASARTNIQVLNRQLQTASTESALSAEKLEAVQADAQKEAQHAAVLRQQLAELARSNQIVLDEKRQLATQLQVAEVKRHAATQQVARMTEEVKIERAEKAKLVEGVKALASNSGQLAREIRENRPLAPNAIFSNFMTNRVQARFHASRTGFFGNESTRNRETETVLVTDGTNTFALCHVQDTPLTFGEPGTDWEGLTGTLSHNATVVPIQSLSFCWPDPRVVLIPVTVAQVRQLGCTVYQISPAPYQFQDAVLIGAAEGYYGECRFQIDPSTPDYLKLDRSFLKGLFGKFNPSRGDLVFSRTGQLLGVMANGTYCMMIHKFDAAATFRFSPDVRDQHTGDTLARLYSFVFQMPLKLQ